MGLPIRFSIIDIFTQKLTMGITGRQDCPDGMGNIWVEGKLVERFLASRKIGRRIIRRAENWSKGKLAKGLFAHFPFFMQRTINVGVYILNF